MASKNLKGITIKIGAETKELNSALREVDKQVYGLNGDLRALDKALKLDPKNTELLAQKQDVLQRNIKTTTDRLNTLKEAQRQMGDYASLTDEQKTKYSQLSAEIAKSESSLKSLNEELKNSNRVDLSKVTAGLKKVGEVALDVAKKTAQIGAAVAGALAGVVTAGVKSYANLEKAQKGSQRLFEDSFKIVEENAKNAYQSLGLSATEYYDQVNQYAVGLKNALGGDTKQAAILSDSILKAQADIVAATGASQDSVQNAFSAVMRGNYTMLDNLRIGIKGSKEGMQEVIDKVNAWNKANGNATNYQMGNYADMEKALVDYTKMVGIAGTAQNDMASSISGSVQQMKSAWDNFINGSGGPEALVDTFKNVAKNVIKIVKELTPKLTSGLTQLFQELLPEVINMILDMAPQLIETAFQLLTNIVTAIVENVEPLVNMVLILVTNICNFLIQNLPMIIQAALNIVMALANGIIQYLPQLIPAVIQILMEIVSALLDNLDLLIDVAINLILALIEGLINSLPKLIQFAPKIIIKLVAAIVKALPKLLTLGPKIIGKIVKTCTDNLSGVLDVGKDIVEGIWKGISDGYEWIKKKIKQWVGNVVSFFKKILHIGSPSRLMADEVGTFMGEGIGMGFVDSMKSVEKQMANAIPVSSLVRDVNSAMTDLNAGINTSMNPTINPTANTNPLILQIENFYNNRETDIQKLSEELEFYRKRSATAKGGN